ncbi:hypothetical protein BAUCODRAFT_157666 [Baudoinia panamericana UAMH 10762]|uniref:Lipocalin-like domain-containing protein n=1 Tax=Baudoinia panamericana (strain UAMH 10762) TaxID=717646 RepID=M2N8L0_BAUPA|nr:uncharacterized protein BAUCODRAFT_157666 [Baudoinia panamericana UAMH 10762]EMC95170.1 hypothetical protein BAUCODRAFT_157666 [Baudoinia panamericana UAMH 10762]
MAVPSTVTMKDMSGTYVLNKTISDSATEMLKMQGIGFIIRQAVAFSTVTNTTSQYTDKDGKLHLDQKQVSTGGITNEEERTIDGEWHESANKIWGKVKGRSRMVKVSELDDDFLKEGWAQDCLEGEVLESVNESLSDTWKATVIFGFADVNGERKHVRRITCVKGNHREKMRQVWDWKAQ